MKDLRHLKARLLGLAAALALLAAGCGSAPVEHPGAVQLDRDGTDGYAGQFVLIYNPTRQYGLSTGSLEKLVETGAVPFPEGSAGELQVDEALYREPDPFVTEEVLAADPCYGLENGDQWGVGFQRVFYTQPLSFPALFQVAAVGETCRVWSPVNPAYGPLEGLDPDYPRQLAQAADEAAPLLDGCFGAIPDVRGDGKANILCYDLNVPVALGMTSECDTFAQARPMGEAERPTNRLPTVHLSTAPLLQGQWEGLDGVTTCAVHELQHLRTIGEVYPAGVLEGYWSGESSTAKYTTNRKSAMWVTEFLSIGAQEMACPGSALREELPWLYRPSASWSDLMAGGQPYYLRNPGQERLAGGSFLSFTALRDDYGVLTLLVHFAENRGGPEIFPAVLEKWREMGCTGDPVQAVWESLGYESFSAFFEDFILSLLLHDPDFEGGRYRLEPFDGYDGTRCGGLEDPFDLLVPVVTESAVSRLDPGAIAIVRPKGNVYAPPKDADQGLKYIGVFLDE